MLEIYKLLGQWKVPDDVYLSQLDKLLSEPDVADGRNPHTLFSSVTDDFWLWAFTEGFRQSPALRQVLPSSPDEQVQLRSNGISGDVALTDGFIIHRWLKAIYEAHVGPLSRSIGVLDFGCGWGRVIRFFMKDVPPSRLHGIDHYRAVIDIAKQTNHWCNFAVTKPFGPTDFEPASLDLVFAYSVFSHLSEDAHMRWIKEFRRILRPGGLLIVTTWERDFILRCAQLREDPSLPFFREHLPTMFQDTPKWLAAYDAGQFCFDSSEASYGAISDYLGEACIPKDYVVRHWTEHLELLDYIEDRRMCSQNVIVARNNGDL